MTFAQEMAAVAHELIVEFGGSATLTRNGSTNKVSAVAVENDHMIRTGFTMGMDERGVLISPKSKIEPEFGDVLTIGTRTYTVKEVQSIQPDFKTQCLYTCKVA